LFWFTSSFLSNHIEALLPKNCCEAGAPASRTKMLVTGVEKLMDYTFLASRADEISQPEQGIQSNVPHKGEYMNITAFRFTGRTGIVCLFNAFSGYREQRSTC
jgi:hypothetical protein